MSEPQTPAPDPAPAPEPSDEELARRGLSRETDIRLDGEGRFFAGAAQVTHPGVARAFARWITRSPDGSRYALRNPIHYVYLTVDDSPLFARRAELGEGGARLLLTSEVWVPLRAQTLRLDAEGERLYALHTRPGEPGRWAVRLLPQALLDLQEALSEDRDGTLIYFWAGQRRAVPRREDPLVP